MSKVYLVIREDGELIALRRSRKRAINMAKHLKRLALKAVPGENWTFEIHAAKTTKLVEV